jgi:hypothetical protein
MDDERFTVRWIRSNSGTLMMLHTGYAVYDRDRRITITFKTLAEAERHRGRIAELYARYRWEEA